jgi:predicted transcriptional regulator
MDETLIELAAGIVASYVENNNISPTELPNLIKTVHGALSGVGQPEVQAQEETAKATSAQIRKSITPDYLVSFIDGKKYKTLKRHLTTHGMTFEEYKAKFGLPKDYPTVSPNYSAQRSEMAKALGLGQGGRGKAAAAAPAKKGKKTAG